MMKKQFIIDGDNIHDIPSFYAEINRAFMSGEDWKLGNSLDAFNDLLYGGLGALQGYDNVMLVWKHIGKSKVALGVEATRKYYEEKLLPDSPFDKEYFRKKLAALEEGKGETYFDILMEIIREHSNIELIIEP
jgi:RNAse (barnase) inhibitor barstar